tara:strand:+ start:2646 stop:3617 length:972 start_codon:yes stop_codon:yes gene_type:complete
MQSPDLLELFRMVLRIRLVEEKIAAKYSEQNMRCPTHLSIGQEATPVAISASLNNNDFAISTHRGHAHYLAKGGDLNSMISEIYGKSTGCSKGKGGSMHLIDKKVGFMGTSAIVGNSIPIGVGLALSSQLKNTNQICVVYLGDGAIEEGVFYESLNFAIIKKLRVLFVCENNLYSVYSPLNVRQPNGREITKMVMGHGIKAETCDGNDIEKCFALSEKVISSMRLNGGPFFLEFKTYRHREHCGPNFDNDIGYRSQQEFDFWKSKDPLLKIKKKLIEKGLCTESFFEDLKKDLDFEVKKAFEFAEESTYPNAEDAFQGVYSKN